MYRGLLLLVLLALVLVDSGNAQNQSHVPQSDGGNAQNQSHVPQSDGGNAQNLSHVPRSDGSEDFVEVPRADVSEDFFSSLFKIHPAFKAAMKANKNKRGFCFDLEKKAFGIRICGGDGAIKFGLGIGIDGKKLFGKPKKFSGCICFTFEF